MTQFLWGVVATLAAVGGLFGAIGAFVDGYGISRTTRWVIGGLVFGAAVGFAVSVVVLGILAVLR